MDRLMEWVHHVGREGISGEGGNIDNEGEQGETDDVG